jgi:hypothetical protein
MGALVTIYRPAGREPGTDLSDLVDRLTIVNVEGPFEPSPEAPAAELIAHHYYSDLPIIVPIGPDRPGMRGPMGGSNYADGYGGFKNAVEKITRNKRHSQLIRIHDRFEMVEGGR